MKRLTDVPKIVRGMDNIRQLCRFELAITAEYLMKWVDKQADKQRMNAMLIT